MDSLSELERHKSQLSIEYAQIALQLRDLTEQERTASAALKTVLEQIRIAKMARSYESGNQPSQTTQTEVA